MTSQLAEKVETVKGMGFSPRGNLSAISSPKHEFFRTLFSRAKMAPKNVWF